MPWLKANEWAGLICSYAIQHAHVVSVLIAYGICFCQLAQVFQAVILCRKHGCSAAESSPPSIWMSSAIVLLQDAGSVLLLLKTTAGKGLLRSALSSCLLLTLSAWAALLQGYVYQLRQHLERLADSATKAGLTSPIALPQMERIVLETAAASRLLNGQSVRPLWPLLSAYRSLPF